MDHLALRSQANKKGQRIIAKADRSATPSGTLLAHVRKLCITGLKLPSQSYSIVQYSVL